MKAIILAGGKGERLRPMTNTLPKPMIKIDGKPVLEHIINLFKKHDITDIIISVCYLKEKIVDYFGDGKRFGVHISYVFESPAKPLGTAGGIVAAKKFIDSTFIVTSGDSLRDLNITDIINFHKQRKAFATIQLYKRFGNDPTSIVKFDKNSQITKFLERPTTVKDEFVWSNGSFYIFEPEIFDFLKEKKPQDFGKDIFPKLLKEKKSLFAYTTEGYFIDIGTIEKLRIVRQSYKPTE